MKKVLHLLASNKFSGAENVVCTIIESFKNEIQMAYCSPMGDIENTLKNKKIDYYPINKMCLSEIKRVVKEYKPDIIHAHDYTASVLATFLGFKGKIISHLHINSPIARTNNIKSLLYSSRIKKMDKIIGVSDAVYNEAIFSSKIRDKYKTIYNYVDKEAILKKSEEYEYEKNYDVLYIGRLNDYKNPLEFINIIKEIKKEKSDIKATMIGSGELRENCEKLIVDNDLVENIKMLGFVDNPFPIIKKCKLCIMPSKVEGFGLTAIENLILNKPVLNSGVGGLKEIFKDNKELICNNINDYKEKYFLYNKNKVTFDNIIKNYTDKNEWKNKIKEIYS